MSRFIPVPTCLGCPHRSHMGAFGRVAYVPLCRRADKTLTHEVVSSPTYRGERLVANADNVIPDWCPLPRLPDGVPVIGGGCEE